MKSRVCWKILSLRERLVELGSNYALDTTTASPTSIKFAIFAGLAPYFLTLSPFRENLNTSHSFSLGLLSPLTRRNPNVAHTYVRG